MSPGSTGATTTLTTRRASRRRSHPPSASEGRTRDRRRTVSSEGRYDVIIIGSGAGGGTLARHLAPSGKRILILERGDWLPREAENWDSKAVFVDNRYVPKETWYDAQGQGLPARDPLRGRRGHQAVRRGAVPPAPAGLRRAPAPRRHLPGVADLVRRPGAVLHESRAALRGPRQPRRGPDRGTRERPVSVPGADPRAAHPAAVGRPGAGGLPPVPRAVRRPAARGRPAEQPLHPVPDLRRLPVPGPGQVGCRDARRPAGAGASQRLAADARDRDRLETNADRAPPSTGVVVERDGARGDVRGGHRGRLGRRRQLRQAAARVGHRSPPERPRQRVGPGRPELHVPQQRRGPGHLQGTEPDDVPEDARAQRLLLRDARTSSTRWATSRWSASPTRRCSRARSRSRPSSRRCSRSTEVATHAVDFWLSTEDLPTPDNRVTLASDGNIRLTYTPNNQEPKQRLYDQLEVDARPPRDASRAPASRAPAISRTRSRSRVSPTRPGTVRFGTDPATSVLDVDCKAHELDNLYVVDTSFFPSIGAVNPALTAMANALRVGDHLLDGSSCSRRRRHDEDRRH